MGPPSCWRGIRLGRNANCYSTTPPAMHLADFYPLTHVEEVKFAPTVPAVIRLWRGDPRLNWALRPEKIPYSWLGLVIKHAGNLKRLDLSLMSVGEDNVALLGLTAHLFRYAHGLGAPGFTFFDFLQGLDSWKTETERNSLAINNSCRPRILGHVVLRP